jgi:DNA-binding transcriptional MerR regulator
MQQFTIRDIENLTGIKAHTLRIWEQRYEFFKPQRKESQHRFYDNEDLKALLRISFLYHSGWKVSKIASLTAEEISKEVRETQVADAFTSQFVSRLIEAALDFDSIAFTNVLEEIEARIGFEKTILEVCYPYLKKIGLLWSTNRVIPSQEHFSSYIIQNRIIAETDRLPAVKKNLRIVLISPQGEFHELPLLFVNYMLKKNQCGTLYLGTNIKTDDLLKLESIPGISSLFVYLITNFTGETTDDYLESLCKTFSSTKIIAAGEGIRNVERNFANLQLLKSDEQILEFVRQGFDG